MATVGWNLKPAEVAAVEETWAPLLIFIPTRKVPANI